MQKMAIFQRFSRTFRENSALAKSVNVFTIGGDLMACPQVKSGNGLNIINATVADGRIKGKVISPCSYFSTNEVRPRVTCGSNTLMKNTLQVAAQQGSYLANSVKNPEGRHCFHTSRYNNFGLFAPLGVQQAVAQLPGYARSFSRGKKKGPRQIPDRNRNIRDFKRRQLAEKYELRRNLHKALIRDPELPFAMRMKHRAKLSALPRNSSFTRARNRCVISGRPRGVYQRFRMSRIEFRLRALKGELIGVKKASW